LGTPTINQLIADASSKGPLKVSRDGKAPAGSSGGDVYLHGGKPHVLLDRDNPIVKEFGLEVGEKGVGVTVNRYDNLRNALNWKDHERVAAERGR
jgi:hypothetical protein